MFSLLNALVTLGYIMPVRKKRVWVLSKVRTIATLNETGLF